MDGAPVIPDPEKLEFNVQSHDGSTGLENWVDPWDFVKDLSGFADVEGCWNDPSAWQCSLAATVVVPGIGRTAKAAKYLDEFQHAGRVRFEALDHLNRPQAMHASISKKMLDTGDEAGRISPPGWRGHGTKFNEGRGHLLARMLGGYGTGKRAKRNLVTLTQDPVNTPWMRDLIENPIYKAVSDGEVVQYTVRPIYGGGNPIPLRLEFEAYGNKGFQLSGFLDNPASGVRTAVQ
jgi:hypothetical protein